jgi:predicted SAM-dependent methyltransferase
MKKLLHVGCGTFTKKDTIPYFFSDLWHEIRYDIDPAVKPDIVGTLTDISALASESVDAIYSAHNIEHLFIHEVDKALSEFHRVLKDDGFLVITCPDLQSLGKFIGENGLSEVAYVSQSGPITAHDILYGYESDLKKGNLYMAHKCGFDAHSMHQKLIEASFFDCASFASVSNFSLWTVARKSTAVDINVSDFAHLIFSGLTTFEA